MLVYKGLGLTSHIRKELVNLLTENVYRSVVDVVGADHKEIYWRRREESVRYNT
jgi:dihydroorotate dehydrogenase